MDARAPTPCGGFGEFASLPFWGATSPLHNDTASFFFYPKQKGTAVILRRKQFFSCIYEFAHPNICFI